MERDQPALPAGAIDAALSGASAGAQPLDKPRTPWLAALLGLVCSPLAFAYVGKAAWGLGVNALIVAIFAALGQSGFVQSAAGVWSLLAASLVALLLCIVLPWRFAIAARQQYRLKWYNRWYWYVLFVALVNAPGGYLFLHHARYFGFDTFRVPSGSMSTTINPGEMIVADTRPSVVAALKPGDIAVMWSSKRSELYVKRIVAGPGQHVQIEEDGLTVDGVLQDRTHTMGSDTMQAKWMRYAEVQLGADEYYLMGDNRGNSFDSRTEGPVPRADLRAKVTTIYFSRDTSRIGKLD